MSSDGMEQEVKAGDIEIKVREDKVSLHYTIGGTVGSCWGETVEEAFQNFVEHHADEDLRPNPEEGRYILPDVDFPKCPNCGDYSSADHHEWVGDRIVGCSVDAENDDGDDLVTDGGQPVDGTELAFPGCPDCKYALRETADGLECPGCGRTFHTGADRNE